MFSKILVATDMLPTSVAALHAGLMLAHEQAASVAVVYVLEVWTVDRLWFTAATTADIAFHEDFLKARGGCGSDTPARLDHKDSLGPPTRCGGGCTDPRGSRRKRNHRDGSGNRERIDRHRDARSANYTRISRRAGRANREPSDPGDSRARRRCARCANGMSRRTVARNSGPRHASERSSSMLTEL